MHLCNCKSEQKCFYLLGTDYISEQFFQGPRTWTNCSKGKSDLVVDPDQQYKNSLQIELIGQLRVTNIFAQYFD